MGWLAVVVIAAVVVTDVVIGRAIGGPYSQRAAPRKYGLARPRVI
jgi:hypothetical protein